jgi:hypothetical protein
MKKNIVYALSIALLLAAPYAVHSMNLSGTGNLLEVIGAKTDFYNALKTGDFAKAAKAVEEIRKYDPELADHFHDKLDIAKTESSRRGGAISSVHELHKMLRFNLTQAEENAFKTFETAIANKNWSRAQFVINMFKGSAAKATDATEKAILEAKAKALEEILAEEKAK